MAAVIYDYTEFDRVWPLEPRQETPVSRLFPDDDPARVANDGAGTPWATARANAAAEAGADNDAWIAAREAAAAAIVALRGVSDASPIPHWNTEDLLVAFKAVAESDPRKVYDALLDDARVRHGCGDL